MCVGLCAYSLRGAPWVTYRSERFVLAFSLFRSSFGPKRSQSKGSKSGITLIPDPTYTPGTAHRRKNDSRQEIPESGVLKEDTEDSKKKKGGR